jgi:hypothetical protein
MRSYGATMTAMMLFTVVTEGCADLVAVPPFASPAPASGSAATSGGSNDGGGGTGGGSGCRGGSGGCGGGGGVPDEPGSTISAGGTGGGPTELPKCPGTEVSGFDVQQLGLKGDGVTDDTAALQAAVDALHAQGGGALYFSPGTYLVKSVVLYEGLTLCGEGATIKRPDATAAEKASGAAKWTRTFTTYANGAATYSGDADSAPLVLRGLTIDGNRKGQGSHANYELEQAHLVFLAGDAKKPGKLRVTVEDVVLRDSPADGIAIFHNVHATITSTSAHDCFRGGFTVLGGWTQVDVKGFKADGVEFDTGIDMELSEPNGYAAAPAQVKMNLEDVHLQGDFDVAYWHAGAEGSELNGSNIVVDGPPFSVIGYQAKIHIAGSKFVTGGSVGDGFLNHIRSPSDMTFEKCSFTVSEAYAEKHLGPDIDRPNMAALSVLWGNDLQKKNLKLIDCSFAAAPDIEPSDVTYGIDVSPGMEGAWSVNNLSIEGGSIAQSIDVGVRFQMGPTAFVKNTVVESDTAFSVGYQGQRYYDLTFDSVVAKQKSTWLHSVTPSGDPNCKITHKNISMPASSAAIQGGFQGTQLFGSRLIHGDPANKPVPCLPGDGFSKVASAPPGWTCQPPGTSAASWVPVP